MDGVDILPSDVITDSLPPLPEIPDLPDIPENVIVVPAAPLPVTSDCLSLPPRRSTTTVTGGHTQLTYVTQGNVSYRCEPDTRAAPNETTTTINVPTATEGHFKPPTITLGRRPRQAESGPPPPKRQKTGETVFLAPLPVTGNARPLTRITKQIPKPKPSSDSENRIIKALLAQKSTPYLTRVTAPMNRNIFIRTSSETPGNTKILPVSAPMPASSPNLPPCTVAGSLHAENAGLPGTVRSAFIKTTTADFIPRSSTVDTVMTTHVTTTTAITTPMTAAPQLSYAISPIRVPNAASATVTTTVMTSAGQSLVVISSPSSKSRAAGVTQSTTYVPLQRLYKAKTDAAAAAKKIHNLVRSKALPPSSEATVTTPTSITMLGPQGSFTTAGLTASVQPSINTRAKTHNYTYLEPGEITHIRKVPPRTFPGSRTTCVSQRQASGAAATQQQATIISKTKVAKHAEHHAESQAKTGLEPCCVREVQHASSLAALQDASHARLLAASEESRLKVQHQTPFQARMQAAVDAEKAAAQAATQAQALPAPLQLPVTTQLQIAALGPTQTVSLAQPHGTLNVQLLTPAQAQLLAKAKAQFHATSEGQIHGQAQRVAYSQAQGQPLAASGPQDESLDNSQMQGEPLASSNLQGNPLVTSQQPDQPLITSRPLGHRLATPRAPTYFLAASKPQGHHLPLSQAPTNKLATSQSQRTSQPQGPILITSQRKPQRLAKSQSQGPIFITTQRQSPLVTTQSQGQPLAISQAQSHATLPTQPNVTRPVPIKSTQPNATLIAQLNAPPQMIISKGQQNVPRMQIQANPAQLKNITPAQLTAITRGQLTSSQWRQRPASPTHVQMISPPTQGVAHVQSSPRTRRRLIIKTATPAPPLDEIPVIQSATNETVAAAKSVNEPVPSTSSASPQISEVPSSSIHTTSTLTLSTGTKLIMPHYKTTVFKNLSSIGRAEATQLPTPTTSSGEKLVLRRPATYFPARRSFPTTTQSSTATAVSATTTTTTTTTKPLIHIIRTVPRHMLSSLRRGNPRARPDPNSEIPTYIINQNKPKSEEK